MTHEKGNGPPINNSITFADSESLNVDEGPISRVGSRGMFCIGNESCNVPSEMTTSTQRIRLTKENQELRDKINAIQRMLMQKDLTLKEKNE